MRPWNKESKERRLRAELPRQSQTRSPALNRASRDLDPLSRSTWGAEAPSAAPGHGTGFGSPLGERSQSPVVEVSEHETKLKHAPFRPLGTRNPIS